MEQLALGGVPQRVVRPGAFQLLARIDRRPAVRGVPGERLAHPLRQILETLGPLGVARVVERQLAPHDQLLQKLLGDELVRRRIFLHRQRHFERADLAEMQIRAQTGGGVRHRVVALPRVAPQVVLQEML